MAPYPENRHVGAQDFTTGILIAILILSSLAVTAEAAVEPGSAASAPESPPADTLLREAALKVFPDGISIDWDYVKTNVPYVNYVRDRMEAELYLLVTAQETGSGGIEYTVAMVGQGRFTGMNDTLRYCSKPTDSSETARAGVLKSLEMGLMPYVARTPLAEDIKISYQGKGAPLSVVDRWDSWVFSVSCSPNISGSQVDERRYVSGSLSADRVTPSLKMSYRVSGYYSESRQDLPSKTVHLYKRYGMFDFLAVRSLGEHWGAGVIATGLAQTYQNKKWYVDASPAIEWSVFPYSQSTRREFALFAQVIHTNVRYQELTIYDKTSEALWSWRLSLPGSIKEPWGSFYSNVSFRQYFHDLSIYRLTGQASVSLQVAKGLWFDVTAYYGRYHDLIDQPRRNLTDEEILLNLKSLASTYEYSVGVGFTYTFGSIYKNVVNPRFFGD